MIIDIFMIVGGVWSWIKGWVRGKPMLQVWCVLCRSPALEDTSLSQIIPLITVFESLFLESHSYP